jgi:hypothetical protein
MGDGRWAMGHEPVPQAPFAHCPPPIAHRPDSYWNDPPRTR